MIESRLHVVRSPAVKLFKSMAKTAPPLDVLVLGEHPSAYLAGVLLLDKPALTVAHATIPTERPIDRLVLINPRFFSLHKAVEKLKKKIAATAVHGVTFLSDDATTRGEYRAKGIVGQVAEYRDVRKALCQCAREAGAKLFNAESLVVRRVDEKGFEIEVDGHLLRPRALLLAGPVPTEPAKQLGLPEMFSSDVMRRYSFVRLRAKNLTDMGPKPIMPMSLDLGGKLSWAWMLPGEEEVQLAVEQPVDAGVPPVTLLNKWAEVLRGHGMLKHTAVIRADQIQSMDIPAAGALAREIIGNRTLLFGPAGGFYTACLEDIYPNCWSAVFATDAVRRALKETHLQDALQPYRQEWGTTLGEYLRGPQQNLRFLLPLVYRNPVMSARMVESILLGKSVVR
jgi:flavin-dependent dehydrogenase